MVAAPPESSAQKLTSGLLVPLAGGQYTTNTEKAGTNMALDTSKLAVVERRPGWRGRYFDSPSMTFGHYEFDAGSSIHPHSHPQEEVWQIIEGELEITIGGVAQRAGPGFVAIISQDTLHYVRAISGGKAIVVDYPLRQQV
jgi:quercetin dioxygenase-like cupin family protein